MDRCYKITKRDFALFYLPIKLQNSMSPETTKRSSRRLISLITKAPLALRGITQGKTSHLFLIKGIYRYDKNESILLQYPGIL